MSYMALYRKWRPQTFDEVKGQDHIVTALRNQLLTGRVGHAYLFCGTRGTGKTSVAKIFSRAVNCENPVNGNPCNKCPGCTAIRAGSSLNVFEIDAASNNGVENIRQIREEVKYSPTGGRYRVYIIDEVHMLSPGAFNALLKTLEEPPSYVIFILATTEVQKIPVTVLSRCQRYDFKRITNEVIEKQLEALFKEESIAVEEKALRYIARLGDGSMRDALSLTEQCVAYYAGEELTYEKVLDVLGAVDIEIFAMLTAYLHDGDIGAIIKLIDDVTGSGRDLLRFVSDMIWYYRNMLLIQSGERNEDVLGMSADNMKEAVKQAEDIDPEAIIRYIRILSELMGSMRNSSAKRVLLEIALIKMMRPEMQENLESMTVRLNELEYRLGAYIYSDAFCGENIKTDRIKTDDVAHDKGNISQTAGKEERIIELPEAEYNDLKFLKDKWFELSTLQGRALMSTLKTCSPGYDKKDGFTIRCANMFGYRFLTKNNSESLKEFEKTLADKTGKKFSFKAVYPNDKSEEPQYVKGNRVPGINMDIGIENTK